MTRSVTRPADGPRRSGTRVVCVSVTDTGRELARRLPYERVHGGAGDAVRRLWAEVDGLVLMLATGAAIRIVAPLLDDKARDPAVVCVDESARWAVALCGGHAARANALAREVATALGAEPVITTASDAVGVPPLDLLPGYAASGDVAGVTAAMLAGRSPLVEVALADWPVPAALRRGEGPEKVVVSDAIVAPRKGVVALHPPSLVAGLGCTSEASPGNTARLVEEVLEEAGLAASSVALVATIDRRRDHPAIGVLGLPVRAYSADELARVTVPNPSEVVDAAVGTSSVAEAAALLAAGDGAQLIVAKRTSPSATVAVARRRTPPGRVTLVGLGPGAPAHRTPAAATAVRDAEVVIGYSPYLEQAADLLCAAQVTEASPIGAEVGRARRALAEAAAGRRVAVVCSGDAGVYAMASIVVELAGEVAPGAEIEVVPGVTAALAASSLLGAPLGHDHAIVSLSDLLTPWEVIARRLSAAAEADLVVALYNPRSDGRPWQLAAALDILRAHRPADTPVGVVTDAYRPAQRVTCTTLAEVDPASVGMTSCVLVGARGTRTRGGLVVTPRGYRSCP